MPRALVNHDGESFDGDLLSIADELATMSNDERKGFRDFNSTEISTHESPRLLIVAGPGSGKSFLFRDRIKHWLPRHPDDSIYVSSFVRKLVRDLDNEIENDKDLTDEDRSRVSVSTLHTLARSLVERNGGTTAEPLAKHVRIVVSDRWLDMVWEDVLLFHPDLDPANYRRKELEHQFQTELYEPSEEWTDLQSTYMQLCRFYNAIGFADMIVRARLAVEENPGLNSELLWVLDEFQDFNAAEAHLIEAITATAHGVLVAGDDDQALYQDLKASSPDIIASYYADPDFANAMLPFCSRCDYFICLGAAAFIAKYRDPTGIDKIYLPLKVNDGHTKIQMVGTIMPTAAVDYIAKFLEDNATELAEYEEKLKAGTETDPFLLILTPDKKVDFYSKGRGAGKDELLELVSRWHVVDTGHSEDYRKVLTYCSAAWYSHDNYAVRQVLDYENVPAEEVHNYLVTALDQDRRLAEVLDAPHAALMDLSARVAEIAVEDVDAESKAASIAQLIEISDTATLANELGANPIGSSGNLADAEAEEAIETADAVAAVELMTMFQSKGLSAQHVIVIGCDDVNLNRTAPLTFYVALTRARHSLHLMTSLQANGCHAPHEYQFAIPGACCDFIYYGKTKRESEHLRGMADLVGRLEYLANMTKKVPKKAAAAKKAPVRKKA
jgi:hypothetical protein